MANYKRGNNSFINPYNFISVDWNKTDRESIEDKKGTLSGVINCKLTTVSPIAIPDELKNNSKGHKTYEFMKNPSGEYMIPGSSLRGVIRSAYEAVTNSCFVTAKENMVFTKRVAMQENGKPYLLSYSSDKWILKPAERHVIIIDDEKYRPFGRPEYSSSVRWTFEELHNKKYGQEIFFVPGEKYKRVGKVVERIAKEGEGNVEKGYLYIGEVPPLEKGKCQTRKHFESIFVKKGEKAIDVPQKKIDSLIEVFRCYNNDSINRNKSENNSFYDGVRELLENKEQNIPVWYNPETKKLSLASIGRIAYESTMGEKLNKKSSCSNREKLCKACALFGNASDDGKVGSRIRITDAIMVDNTIETKFVTLKELASPKPSYVEFYTTGKDYDNRNTFLRGRKVYWHNLENNAYRDSEKSKRNTTMEVVPKGCTFEFSVFYDSITEEQLRELKWVLTFGEDVDNSVYCHKIGHGKPIGLGSVRIRTNKVLKREYENNMSYSIEDITSSMNWSCNTLDSSICDEIRFLSDIRTTENVNVSYPFIDNASTVDKKTASFQWFAENKNSKNETQDWREIYNAVEEPFISLACDKTNNGFQPNGRKNEVRYKKEEVVKGKVVGFNGSGFFAKVELQDGKKASFNVKECISIKEGDKVELKYDGKNKKGFDSWRFIKKF